MAFNQKELVFSLEVKANEIEAALHLKDDAQAVEAPFLCGRTNASPGRLDTYEPDIEELKTALRTMLKALES